MSSLPEQSNHVSTRRRCTDRQADSSGTNHQSHHMSLSCSLHRLSLSLAFATSPLQSALTYSSAFELTPTFTDRDFALPLSPFAAPLPPSSPPSSFFTSPFHIGLPHLRKEQDRAMNTLPLSISLKMRPIAQIFKISPLLRPHSTNHFCSADMPTH